MRNLHTRFELYLYTRLHTADPARCFESEHPVPWTVARDRLIASGIIEPYRPGLATGDPGSWLLSVDTTWTNRPGWEGLPLPKVNTARSGVTIRCYGTGINSCGWTGDSGAATVSSMGEERCPQCGGGTVPPPKGAVSLVETYAHKSMRGGDYGMVQSSGQLVKDMIANMRRVKTPDERSHAIEQIRYAEAAKSLTAQQAKEVHSKAIGGKS